MRQFKRSHKNGLYRSRNGVLLGVCKGLAGYFDFSVYWVRAILIICLKEMTFSDDKTKWTY